MSKPSFSLEEIAALTDSTVEGDKDFRINEVCDLAGADAQAASFLDNPRYESAMRNSQAGVVFVHPSTKREDGRNYLLTKSPTKAFQTLLEALYRDRSPASAFTGIHPTAVIADGVEIGDKVTVGPHTVIDQGVRIGNNTVIQAQCAIGPGVSIGDDCLLHPRVTIREGCSLGNRVICQPGAVLGACGYGYHTGADGIHHKLAQLGVVVIEDDVEIGANSTIDRARFQETRIGKGTKIDNLVQIGHNCRIGEHNIICGQTGLSGSVETEKHVTLAGQVAVAGHLKLVSGTIVSGRGAVMSSIEKPGIYTGVPITPHKEQMAIQLHLRHLRDYAKQIKSHEKRLTAIETKETADT